jgi:V8-like Glu-specific endopeptidase
MIGKVHRASRSSVPVATAVGILGFPGLTSHAILMRNNVPQAEYRALGDTFQGRALQMRLLFQGQEYFRCSAVRLNQWYAVSAAHCVTNNGSGPLYTWVGGLSLGNGPDFANPGDVRRVVNIFPHPDYRGSAGVGHTPDLVILQFDSPLPGPDLTIAPFPTGMNRLNGAPRVTSVGYGSFGVEGQSTSTFGLGTRHAYQTDNASASSLDDPFFRSMRADFRDGFQSDVRLLGRSLPGDSGSPVFNEAGAFVAVVSGGSPAGVTSQYYGSSIVNTTSPFAAWIASYTIPPCSRADVARANQGNGPDGALSADDIILWLTWYFSGDWRADIAGSNQTPTPDGQWSADDVIVFLNAYFQGC